MASTFHNYPFMHNQTTSEMPPHNDTGISSFLSLQDVCPQLEPVALEFQEIVNPNSDVHHTFSVAFQGRQFALGFTPDNRNIKDVSIQALFHLVRAEMLPQYLGEAADDIQLMLGFEDDQGPVVHEGESVASIITLQGIQELAALAHQTYQVPRFELLVREDLPCQLTRLRAEVMDALTESESSSSSVSGDDDDDYWSVLSTSRLWSVPSTPREMSLEPEPEIEPEIELEDLGVPIVLFAPERRVTRAMTLAAEAALPPAPVPVPVPHSRPKRAIRRVAMDYEDIIKSVGDLNRTSRL
ncbi:hypothetical protein CPC16_005358 [Podila verticillata]|nr:hypothetical protein CPC16_005358 [Podila verticillata]KFH72025.1 hypothetical protein MVEG_02318 [Podila verticillata NRRL 6337]